MDKGILILALGHSNYGRIATALAAMIKATGSELPIHLGYTDSAVKGLSKEERALFDSSKPIPEKYYGKGFIQAKMYLYQLSPFKKTLYMDADIAWLKKSPDTLFDELTGLDITYANSGVQEASVWADVAAVKKAYGINQVLGIHSELVYFKKEEKVKQFFAAAQDIYKNLKVESTVFAGAIPDELPFMIAAELTGTMPHQQPFLPFFWYKREKKLLHAYEIAKNYYAMSMGGHYNQQHEITMYNLLAKAAYYKLGLRNPYQWKQKQLFLSERQKY